MVSTNKTFKFVIFPGLIKIGMISVNSKHASQNRDKQHRSPYVFRKKID